MIAVGPWNCFPWSRARGIISYLWLRYLSSLRPPVGGQDPVLDTLGCTVRRCYHHCIMFVLKYAVLSCALGRTLSLSLSPPLFLQPARGNVERTLCFRLRMIDEADDDGLLLQYLDFPSFYKA